ncbi:MAG: succinate dehydrogenase cytochrome b subunit [Deltaproteobacteria bacterium]|nr:succinate dehydrogenase cytochrome b subunit [Deltaproteobacteria bacterium]
MNRLWLVVKSSIGKKELMALTGFCLILFLAVHLFGNLNIFRGTAAFNWYAETLHSLPAFVKIFEIGLLTIGAIHVFFATILVVQNLWARPHRYSWKRWEGGRSWGSWSMLVTGPYILLFVIFHLLQFTLIDKAGRPISTIVAERFQQPAWVAFYAISMVFVGLHISHGFWSGFQTLGVQNERRGELRSLGLLVSLLFGVTFGAIPIAVYGFKNLLQ